jgi:hypothetical protein
LTASRLNLTVMADIAAQFRIRLSDLWRDTLVG